MIGDNILTKPPVNYSQDIITVDKFNLRDVLWVFVEGTYANFLTEYESQVFMTRTYGESNESRKEKAQDPVVPFIDNTLEMEHNHIKDKVLEADVVVDKNYNVTFV